jgi:hypothetical protein
VQGDSVKHLVRTEPRGDRPRVDLRRRANGSRGVCIEVDVGIGQINDPVVVLRRLVLRRLVLSLPLLWNHLGIRIYGLRVRIDRLRIRARVQIHRLRVRTRVRINRRVATCIGVYGLGIGAEVRLGCSNGSVRLI